MTTGILIVWMFIFAGTLYLGLEKGLKKLSTFNVWLAIAVMMFILFAGPTVSLIKAEINSLGLYASEFIHLNTRIAPYENESFVERWTVFYWGWWIAFMPMMGMFVARISRGRTIRNVIWGQMIWGTLGMLYKLYDFWRLFSVFTENRSFRYSRNFGRKRTKRSGSSYFADATSSKAGYDSSLCIVFYLSCNNN